MTSYINKEQFSKLYDAIMDINQWVTGHSDEIDSLENKLLEVQRKRKLRKHKKVMNENDPISTSLVDAD